MNRLSATQELSATVEGTIGKEVVQWKGGRGRRRFEMLTNVKEEKSLANEAGGDQVDKYMTTDLP